MYRAVVARNAVSRQRQDQPALPGWVAVPVVAALASLLLLIIALTPAQHLPGAALAYVNLLIICGAAVYFLREGTLQGLIPVIFLTWLAAAWPLASIYFATRFPTAVYTTLAEDREFLFRNTWLQAVTLLFLVCYLTALFLLRGRYPAWSSSAGSLRDDRRAATIVLCIAMSAITLHAVSKVAAFPELLQYTADGGFIFLHSLILMVGVLFLRLPLPTRCWALLFMVFAGAFYTIGNARGQAALPMTLLLIGLIFLSDLDLRWKVGIVSVVVVGFPLGLVISNTTRLVTQTIGFVDLATRLKALQQWQEVLSDTPVLASTFGRLFFTGGHSVVTLSPERYPYVDFSWTKYLWEFVMRVLPRKFFYDPYYSSNPNVLLRKYDFIITDETSTPLSLIGGLYVLGGVVPVMVGGLFLGAYHALFGRLIARLNRASKHMALLVFALTGTHLLWAQNLDLITHVRGTIWAAASGIALYLVVIRPFLGLPVRGRRVLVRRRRLMARPA